MIAPVTPVGAASEQRLLLDFFVTASRSPKPTLLGELALGVDESIGIGVDLDRVLEDARIVESQTRRVLDDRY